MNKRWTTNFLQMREWQDIRCLGHMQVHVGSPQMHQMHPSDRKSAAPQFALESCCTSSLHASHTDCVATQNFGRGCQCRSRVDPAHHSNGAQLQSIASRRINVPLNADAFGSHDRRTAIRIELSFSRRRRTLLRSRTRWCPARGPMSERAQRRRWSPQTQPAYRLIRPPSPRRRRCSRQPRRLAASHRSDLTRPVPFQCPLYGSLEP